MTSVFKDFSFLDQFLKMLGAVVTYTIIKEMLVGAPNDRDGVDLDIGQALDYPVSCIFFTTKLIIPKQTL